MLADRELWVFWLSELHEREISWSKASWDYNLFECHVLGALPDQTASKLVFNYNRKASSHLSCLSVCNVEVGVINLHLFGVFALLVNWAENQRSF